MNNSGSAIGCLFPMLIAVGIVVGAIMLKEAQVRDLNTDYNKGMEDLTMERYISAIDEFDKVLMPNLVWILSKSSLRAQAYIGRGRAKTALRNFDVAIKDFDKALKLNPEQEIEQQAYSYRAIALEALNSKY